VNSSSIPTKGAICRQQSILHCGIVNTKHVPLRSNNLQIGSLRRSEAQFWVEHLFVVDNREMRLFRGIESSRGAIKGINRCAAGKVLGGQRNLESGVHGDLSRLGQIPRRLVQWHRKLIGSGVDGIYYDKLQRITQPRYLSQYSTQAMGWTTGVRFSAGQNSSLRHNVRTGPGRKQL
jgi:hypothetical protein